MSADQSVSAGSSAPMIDPRPNTVTTPYTPPTYPLPGPVQVFPLPPQARTVTHVSTPEEIRRAALDASINFFSYVRREKDLAMAVVRGTDDELKIGARAVLGMAEHFADYIAHGTHPDAPEETTDG